MRACPKCKGRATKLVNISTGLVTCQQCGHRYPIPDPKATNAGRSLPATFRLELCIFMNDDTGHPISCIYREVEARIHDQHHIDTLLAFMDAMKRQSENGPVDTQEEPWIKPKPCP